MATPGGLVCRKCMRELGAPHPDSRLYFPGMPCEKCGERRPTTWWRAFAPAGTRPDPSKAEA